MYTRLNNFQTRLSRNNPSLKVNKNNNNVRVARRNINKNNLFATFRNTTRGNTLTVQTMYTYQPLKGRGYQKKFVNAAEKAARKVGYRRLNALSVYIIARGNKKPTNKNEPNSYYLLKGRGFNVVRTKGKRGVHEGRNRYSVYLNKLL